MNQEDGSCYGITQFSVTQCTSTPSFSPILHGLLSALLLASSFDTNKQWMPLGAAVLHSQQSPQIKSYGLGSAFFNPTRSLSASSTQPSENGDKEGFETATSAVWDRQVWCVMELDHRAASGLQKIHQWARDTTASSRPDCQTSTSIHVEYKLFNYGRIKAREVKYKE